MERAELRDHAALADLAELAVLGVLEPDEQRLLRDHLREGCAVCEERRRRGLASLEVLALAAPPAAPSPALREGLLAGLSPAASGTAPRAGWRAALPALAAGIALVLAVGSLLEVRRMERNADRALDRVRAELRADLAERDGRVQSLASRLSHFEQVLSTSGAEVRVLTPAGDASTLDARARVVVDPTGHQVLLLASRLPPPPPGHTYQLWIIAAGVPRSLGVFDPDAGGRALHVESEPLDVSDAFSVAVSVEPAGGVDQPTGPIVLASH
jgi:anti-sigma-K factor RskA